MAFKRNNNVIDSPGNNFATLNPLVQTSATLSEGNLKCAVGTSAAKVFGNFLLPNSGKWYWEVMFISGGDNSEAGGGVGIAKITTSTSAHVGNDAESYASVEAWFFDPEGNELTDEPLAFLPAKDLMEMIKKHGGIVKGELPPLRLGDEEE